MVITTGSIIVVKPFFQKIISHFLCVLEESLFHVFVYLFYSSTFLCFSDHLKIFKIMFLISWNADQFVSSSILFKVIPCDLSFQIWK